MDKFEIVALDDPVFHWYEYGAVPPDSVTVAIPSAKPLQVIFCEEMDAINAAGSVTRVLATVLQPFASTTVTV